MDTNRKRKGFMKSKLIPLYKSMKPSSSDFQYNTNKSMSQTPQTQFSSQYLFPQDYSAAAASINHNPNSSSAPKVSFVVAGAADNSSREKKLSQLAERWFGAAHIDDRYHSVDESAERYISLVKERFGLERVNSERVRSQEMPVEIDMVMNE